MDRAWGFVLNVYDGDTFEIDIDSVSRHNTHTYRDVERVRLRSVSAPELSESGGVAARERLRRRLLGRRVRVDIHARDAYGRPLVDVTTNV